MKLYEIDELISKCVVVNDNEAVDTSTGEIIDIDYLDHLQMERNKKTEYLIKLYLNCLSDAEALKAEADGYATSSTYVNTLCATVKKYELEKYDTGNLVVQAQEPYLVGKTYTTTSDLNIREQPFGSKMKFECITQNAKEHSFFDDYGNAILKKGTRVTCKAISKQTNSIWILIPSGWICARNSKNIYIV